MAEVRELKSMVEKLQAELNGSQTAKQYVVYKQERKLKKFNGKQTDDNHYGQIEEFAREVLSVFTTRKMTNEEKVEFILTHLEGPAREEIRLHPSEHQNNPEKLIEILRSEFGEKLSIPELYKVFYNRRQKDQESLRDYSHALASLHERLKQKSDEHGLTDVALRDQFVDNVKDAHLRRELKRLIRSENDISFLDIRSEALKWSEDEVQPNRRCSIQEISTKATSADDVITCDTVAASGIEELRETLSRQQKMIEDLLKTVKTLEENKKPTKSWERKSNYKNVECYHCHKQGHIARNCPDKHQQEQGGQGVKPQQEQRKSSGLQSQSNNYPPRQ